MTPLKNLAKSGKALFILHAISFSGLFYLLILSRLKLCGVDAQEAPGTGGVCRHEWIIHSCDVRR